MPSLKLLKTDPSSVTPDSKSATPAGTSLKGRARDRLAELTPLEREFLPHLLEIQETPPSPLKQRVLWTIIALVVIAILWACLGELSIVSTATGKFIPDGRVKEIQPLESSIVKAIHVKEGQRVKEGELLLELDPTINAAELKASADKYDYNRLEQTRLRAELTQAPARYDTQGQPREWIALQENIRHSREAAHAAKVTEAQALVAERASALEAAQATLRKYQETTTIIEEREASTRPLVDSGAISKMDYLQLKQELIANRNDLAAQTQTVEQARHAKTEAEQQLAKIERDRVAQVYTDLGDKIGAAPVLKGDLDKSRQLYDLKWLNSPVSGLIQKIDVTTLGAVVTPAQNLVTIVPDGTPLIVEAQLSNEDIGYVRVGQSVEIKVDTFPFQKYGTLKGTLVWISPDAEDKGQDNSSRADNTGSATGTNSKPSKAGYVYKVHVRPEQTEFIVDGKRTSIQPGMTVQADITTDHRRIIEFFLSPVIKYLDEGLRVR